MSYMTLPFLPPEVTDRIIRFVWPDKRTLCSCALVCREWLPASRSHLFYEINLNSAASYDAFVKDVLRRRHMKPWLLSVRNFKLSDPRPNHYPGEPPRTLVPRDLQHRRGHQFLPEFANHFPNLQSMTITNVDWIVLPPHWSAHSAISSYRGVRELSVHGCHFSSFNTFRRMLSALSSLVSLFVQEVAWTPGSGRIPPGPMNSPPGPALQLLTVIGRSTAYDPLFEWLLTTPSQFSLTDFTYQPRGDWTDAALHFLRHLPHTVARISLPLYTGDTVLPLSQLSGLRVLRVVIDVRRDDTSFWLKIPPMLQDLQSPLHELRFFLPPSIDFVDRTGGRDSTMAFLDTFLQLPVFRELRRVVFHLQVRKPCDDLADMRLYLRAVRNTLKQRLSLTSLRKILGVAA